MTLSPVFRSQSALATLAERGYMAKLQPSIDAQRSYTTEIRRLLADVIDWPLSPERAGAADDDEFLQDHFFLILFDSLFRTLKTSPERSRLYGLLNRCIKGLVVAGDNLFDDESKQELPLELAGGPRFGSIIQLLCFDNLLVRALDVHGSSVGENERREFRRRLMTALASIGTLEGAEEGGVSSILPVSEMIEKVHRVRGGALFSLAFIAPLTWETDAARWESARRGIARIGTAFQIVDDMVDFEFDLGRRSHNILSAVIHESGTPDERKAFAGCTRDRRGQSGLVETHFGRSAAAVLDLAYGEATAGFAELSRLGFWFSPDDAVIFVRSIAGDAGEARMRVLTA